MERESLPYQKIWQSIRYKIIDSNNIVITRLDTGNCGLGKKVKLKPCLQKKICQGNLGSALVNKGRYALFETRSINIDWVGKHF